MSLSDSSLLNASPATVAGEASFFAVNRLTGETLAPEYPGATAADVNRSAALAAKAFAGTKALSGASKARFLRLIATKLENQKAPIVARAHLETALPLARLEGEVGRTASQLRLFADLVEEGSWVDARLDPANPERQPLPKPDVRSMLRALGPVVVFGASNFPLAFSVAGGDTAAAFAAGCPVIVKAHPAHPGTSQMVGKLIDEAAEECGLPQGTFSLLFDAGHDVGLALVRHPLVKAVGFTGSRRGGLALMREAAARAIPIPVFAEMSSINPIVITPGALRARGGAIATGLQGAITLGVGQFCTNPGLVLVPQGQEGDAFVADLTAKMSQTAAGPMLTAGISAAYQVGIQKLEGMEGVIKHLGVAAPSHLAEAALFEVTAPRFLTNPNLMEEVFGPSSLVVRYHGTPELNDVIQHLEGQLTATFQIETEEMESYGETLSRLEDKVGRLIINGFPTGVEVGHAMVHGGPFPSTSDGQSTSVGTRAIVRFTRPVCYQGFPDEGLPAELQSANPLGIFRLVDGQLTQAPL